VPGDIVVDEFDQRVGGARVLRPLQGIAQHLARAAMTAVADQLEQVVGNFGVGDGGERARLGPLVCLVAQRRTPKLGNESAPYAGWDRFHPCERPCNDLLLDWSRTRGSHSTRIAAAAS
jgi:hypothetical protein